MTQAWSRATDSGLTSPERSPTSPPIHTARMTRRIIFMLRVSGRSSTKTTAFGRKDVPSPMATARFSSSTISGLTPPPPRRHADADDSRALDRIGHADRRSLGDLPRNRADEAAGFDVRSQKGSPYDLLKIVR